MPPFYHMAGPSYFLVTVIYNLPAGGGQVTKDNVKLYFCDANDSTFNDLLTNTYNPEEPLPYITMFKYNQAVGGSYSTAGYQVVQTGEQIVSSWMGEVLRYYFGYPTTDAVYWESVNTRIIFESGAEYIFSDLYATLSSMGLMCVTIDNVNFTTLREYYVDYGAQPSASASTPIKKLDGSSYAYIRPSGIKYTDVTNATKLARWRTIFGTEPIHGDEPPGPEPKEDPYEQGGESGEEGGEGDFDNTSDEIEIPDLPTASTVINTGFITLYDANIYDLNDLASYLWSANGLDLETFKKIFADPISAILGLSIFPCSPEITTQDVNVILGNIDTGVGMRKVTNQYRRYDMGTLNLNEYWGGYLDYSPYTSVEIYLPYIGTRTLNADDVMGKALHLVYNIDFLSGSCCAILEVGGTVLYQFMGQCSCPVPVTGRDMTNLVNGVMSVVGAGVGTLVATGGNAALAGASAIGSLASHVTSSKPKIEKSGAMGGMGGMLGVRKPYLVVTRPRQALPASQNTYTGYPSYMTCMLGDLIGFTVMETVHLQDMSATDEEKAEIDRLLKSGVVL